MKKILVTLIIIASVSVTGCSLEEASVSEQDKQAARVAQNNVKLPEGKTTYAVKLLDKLVVAEEVDSGYDRDLFPHWSDLDGNGCDTREDILYRDNLEKGADCSDRSGRWLSAYDGETTTNPSSFDVDHMVPLAEAWASGADKWNEPRREAYANDIYPYSLIAVSAASNRSKSDQDPAEWMPENQAFRCFYVARWIAVKFRWSLTIDNREKTALKEIVNSCPDDELVINGKLSPASVKIADSNSSSGVDSDKEVDPRFSSCAKAVANGYGNYQRGDKEYSWYIDGDNDGVACER